MRNLPVIFVVWMLISSCTSFQYHTLNSSISSDSMNAFEFENDSLRIRYSFVGEGGLLNIRYFNKLDQPVIIKWDQSAVILDGQSVSTWQDEANVDLQGEFFISGKISKPSAESFIPPRSELSRNVMQVMRKSIATTLFKASKEPFGQGEAKVYRFTNDDSPLHLRTFITVGSIHGNDQNILDHSFWLQITHESLSGPNYHFRSQKPFYTARSTEAGILLGLVAVGALIVALLNTQ